MSFILDALRKSENERQEHKSNDFATVPSGRDSSPAPRWLWVLGSLLAINIIVVAGVLLRPDAQPPDLAESEPLREVAAGTAPDGAAPPENDAAGEPAFEERLQAARQNQPLSSPRDNAPADAGDTRPAVAARDIQPPPPARRGVATLPSLEELQLEGAVDLPPLHIDLHVFNESPTRRFVSINMNKYRENERMAEGPVVREITREGVILEYEGKEFALMQ